MSYGPTEHRLVGGVHELLGEEAPGEEETCCCELLVAGPDHLLQRGAKSEVRLDTPAADVLRWESC